MRASMPSQEVMGCVRKLAKLEPESELVSSLAPGYLVQVPTVVPFMTPQVMECDPEGENKPFSLLSPFMIRVLSHGKKKQGRMTVVLKLIKE